METGFPDGVTIKGQSLAELAAHGDPLPRQGIGTSQRHPVPIHDAAEHPGPEGTHQLTEDKFE